MTRKKNAKKWNDTWRKFIEYKSTTSSQRLEYLISLSDKKAFILENLEFVSSAWAGENFNGLSGHFKVFVKVNNKAKKEITGKYIMEKGRKLFTLDNGFYGRYEYHKVTMKEREILDRYINEFDFEELINELV